MLAKGVIKKTYMPKVLRMRGRQFKANAPDIQIGGGNRIKAVCHIAIVGSWKFTPKVIKNGSGDLDGIRIRRP